MPDDVAICPNCETTGGVVGDPCPTEVCARKGYRRIPAGWYSSAREHAARRNRPMDPLLGRSLDRYLLIGRLGEGGMGTVYVALQRPLMREVAVKVISGLDLTETTVGRFEREARAVATLDHPNIVKLHDYGVSELETPGAPDDGPQVRVRMPYMALEYLRHGRSLRRALAEVKEHNGGVVPGAVVLSIFEQVLNALTAAHAAGIVHRDMKPDNVMVLSVPGNPHHVKVLDFGLAKAVTEVSGFDGEISKTGQLIGTPYYMAPEQAPGPVRGEVDARSDLYAIAVMLFEVFTGERPFEGQSALEVLSRKVDPDWRPLDRPAARALPRGLREFLARGMAAYPAERFGAASEMSEALRAALSGKVATAVGLAAGGAGSSSEHPMTPPSAGVAPRPPARRVSLAAGMVVGLVVAIGVAAGAYLAVTRAGGTHAGVAAAGKDEDVHAAAANGEDITAGEAVTALAGTVDDVPSPPPPMRPAPVRLEIRSTPGGARVLIDGRPVGETPLVHVFDGELADREVEVQVVRDGFERASRRARPSEAAREGLDFHLAKKRRAWKPPL